MTITSGFNQLRNIREAQAKVTRRIQEIRDQLGTIEASLPAADKAVPRIGTCMSGELRIWCVEYVKAPPPKLRDELLRELVTLGNQMRTLRLREQKHAHQGRMRRKAARQSTEFDKQLTAALKEAEKTGSLDDAELADLLEGSEKVLGNYLNMLRTNPSVENVGLVLHHMTTPALLGADTWSGTSGEAFGALGQAAGTLAKHAQDDFDRVPSVANFDRLLSRVQLRMQLGGGEWSFKQPPRANTTHAVAAGDTLSGIAEKHYGDQSYWPVIYMENFKNLDPTKLQVGTVLKIP